jgi:nucleoside-triphosphatase
VPRIRPETAAADLIVIDEIGKMECLSEPFRRAVVAALAASVPVLATIGKGGNDFIRSIGRRTDVERKEITPENRDALAEELGQRLGQALGRRALSEETKTE